jgi:hypothetical protein
MYVSFSVKCGGSVVTDKTRTMKVNFMNVQFHTFSFPLFSVLNFTPRKNHSYHNVG